VGLCEHDNEFAACMRVVNYYRIKSNIFWDVKTCSPLKVNGCSEGTSRLYIQGARRGQARNQHEAGRKFCSLCNIHFFVCFLPPFRVAKFCDFPSRVFDESKYAANETRLLGAALDLRQPHKYYWFS
jgi:hypothetical protein